jgi:hypothetical protein
VDKIVGDSSKNKRDVEGVISFSAFHRLQEDYENRRGGFLLAESGGGISIAHPPDLASWIKRLKGTRPVLLSPAGLENFGRHRLRQHVGPEMLEIDAIRGVDVGGGVEGSPGQEIGAHRRP